MAAGSSRFAVLSMSRRRSQRRLLSPEAAFLTLEMLGQIPRPGMTEHRFEPEAPVFWKTGTSHGFRDAWSVAVFDRYVLAVWVGNFDGQAQSRVHRPHRARRRSCFK